jgi:hypothetical protein
VADGGQATVTVNVIAGDAGEVQNTATVSSDVNDPVTGTTTRP